VSLEINAAPMGLKKQEAHKKMNDERKLSSLQQSAL
jgi:hypothetical protein